MRKPRDYAAELKTLDDRAHKLREARIRQFGELMVSISAFFTHSWRVCAEQPAFSAMETTAAQRDG